MDAEIQFGDLEHAEPEVRLRPDHNRHFAVAAFASPSEKDLPIFVDMDVMRDMESHALSDTSVELGGVMLGGQYTDEDGESFVVVTDSLRAQHFEATKGSFKFTHETWEQISRERDEFPEDLQMVGWYHTHPDWGVFLSGMDMFICDNFFNRPLDLALVIDPCRGDRGMFQWTPDPRDRVRRTGGYYLISSRFRLQELELYACQLEGRITMASDSRYGIAGHVGPSATPVVNISENRGGAQGLAVMGMLMMQFLLLTLIAWRMLVPATGDSDEQGDEKQAKQIVAIEQKIDALAEADAAKRNLALESQIQTQVLDQIVSQLVRDPENLVEQLAEQKRELAFREAEHRSDMRLVQLLHEEKAKLDIDITTARKELAKANNEREDYKEKLSAASKEAKTKTEEVATLKKEIASLTGKAGSDKAKDDESSGGWSAISIGITVAIILVVLVAGVGFTVLMRKPEAADLPTDADAGKGPASLQDSNADVEFQDGSEPSEKPNDS